MIGFNRLCWTEKQQPNVPASSPCLVNIPHCPCCYKKQYNLSWMLSITSDTIDMLRLTAHHYLLIWYFLHVFMNACISVLLIRCLKNNIIVNKVLELLIDRWNGGRLDASDVSMGMQLLRLSSYWSGRGFIWLNNTTGSATKQQSMG